MSQFTFIDPETGKEFVVKGPAGLTESQAAEIFAQQKDKGSLVNLKTGDILNAAKQAAGGLTSAIAQVEQAAAGIAGGVTGALGGALQTAQGAVAGVTSAVSGAVSGAVGAVSGAVSGAVGAVKSGLQSATSLSTGLSGALGSAKSLAEKTLSGIASATKGISITNGIDVQNFAKQATALVPIKGLSVTDLTATMSQASKLVGQGADTLSNLGAGKFGLDCKQLELAGMVKPGTAAKYLSSGVNDLTSVLKSPSVWTGKDGIGSVDSLLKSIPSQDKIQQTLMNTGLNNVQALGIPINSLDPSKLAGTALNAAKSAQDTLAWAAGSASSAVKSAFDQVARAGEFAVDFAKGKIDSAMSNEVVPEAANYTVDRKTLNAATTRIIGNKKIPQVSYEEPTASALDPGGTPSTAETEQAESMARVRAAMNGEDVKVGSTNEDVARVRAAMNGEDVKVGSTNEDVARVRAAMNG